MEPIEIESLHDLEVVIYWCCMQGIGCVFLLLIGLGLTVSVVESCDRTEYFFGQLFYFVYIFVIICQGIYKLCFKKVDETGFVRIINTMQEMSRNLTAQTIPFLAFSVVDYCESHIKNSIF